MLHQIGNRHRTARGIVDDQHFFASAPALSIVNIRTVSIAGMTVLIRLILSNPLGLQKKIATKVADSNFRLEPSWLLLLSYRFFNLMQAPSGV